MSLRAHQHHMKTMREAKRLERQQNSKRYGLDPRTKLTRDQIVAIKLKPANMTHQECADAVGVKKWYVSSIWSAGTHPQVKPKEGETWISLMEKLSNS